MYEVPCLTDEEIRYYAKQGKLFQTLYGIPFKDTPYETGVELRKLRRGWFCVRCGYCCVSCTSDRTIVFPPTNFKSPQRFSSKMKRVLQETSKRVNLNNTLCPHIVGCYPGNIGCAIHRLNKKLATPCYLYRPNASIDMPCLRGILWIHNMDVDFLGTLRDFNTLKNNKQYIIY